MHISGAYKRISVIVRHISSSAGASESKIHNYVGINAPIIHAFFTRSKHPRFNAHPHTHTHRHLWQQIYIHACVCETLSVCLAAKRVSLKYSVEEKNALRKTLSDGVEGKLDGKNEMHSWWLQDSCFESMHAFTYHAST